MGETYSRLCKPTPTNGNMGFITSKHDDNTQGYHAPGPAIANTPGFAPGTGPPGTVREPRNEIIQHTVTNTTEAEMPGHTRRQGP